MNLNFNDDYQNELTEKRRAAIWRGIERYRRERAAEYRKNIPVDDLTPIQEFNGHRKDQWIFSAVIFAMILAILASAICLGLAFGVWIATGKF